MSVHRGGAAACSSPPAKSPGSVATNSTSRTPAQIRLSDFSCAATGAWNACVRLGIARIAAATVVSVAIIRARGESKRCVP